MSTIVAQICIRRDTAANFTSANPTLALGEIAYETDTRNIKVGDGATAWTALPYINPYRGGTAAAPTSNTVLGPMAGNALASGAVQNVLIGSDAGRSIVNSDFNVAVGANAMRGFDAALNTAVGYNAMGTFASGNTGSQNVAFGYNAATSLRGGSQNVAIGPDALATNQSANDNVAVGFRTAFLNTASDITAVGANALDANTTGTSNTAVGRDALGAVTTGSSNTALGHGALDAITTQGSNTAIGANALGSACDQFNTAVGAEALAANTSNLNVAVGYLALGNTAAASGNTAIGTNAGRFRGTGTDALATGSNSVFVGYNSRASADGQSNQIVIGHDALGNGSNTTTIGNSSTTGTFIPAGDLTLTNGNFIVGTSGKGIDFSATANSSGTMTSELLSDYEEGTWTPAYSTNGTGFTTMTMDPTVVGRYTKIGRMVTVFAYMTTDDVDATGATGNVVVTGLPFTVSGSNGFFAGSIAFIRFFAASGFPCAAYAQTSTTYIRLEKRAASNGATALLVPADLVAGANNDQNQLLICLSYFV